MTLTFSFSLPNTNHLHICLSHSKERPCNVISQTAHTFLLEFAIHWRKGGIKYGLRNVTRVIFISRKTCAMIKQAGINLSRLDLSLSICQETCKCIGGNI